MPKTGAGFMLVRMNPLNITYLEKNQVRLKIRCANRVKKYEKESELAMNTFILNNSPFLFFSGFSSLTSNPLSKANHITESINPVIVKNKHTKSKHD